MDPILLFTTYLVVSKNNLVFLCLPYYTTNYSRQHLPLIRRRDAEIVRESDHRVESAGQVYNNSWLTVSMFQPKNQQTDR